MKKRLVQIGLAVGAVALFVWAINNSVNSIAYGIDSGDALGGLMRLGIPILPILGYMLLVKIIASKITKQQNNAI